MSRRDGQRLEDIQVAIDAIATHLQRGELHDGLVFDAVRVRLIEIGEAIKALPAGLLAAEADLPWAQIAGMSHRLAHRSFDTWHAILADTVKEDLSQLEAATRRLLQRVEGT